MHTTEVREKDTAGNLGTQPQDCQQLLGELYTRYYPKVYHSCLSYAKSHDDAFDLAQDILLKALYNLAAFEGKSTFSTWIYAITRNHCISQVTKNKRFHQVDIHDAHHLIAQEFKSEDFETRAKKEQLEIHLKQYLDMLPARDRQMLELKYFHNYSIKDLQGKFNLSASAVKMRLLRARQRIEQIMDIQPAA
jgi:RNA polymerase sigma-70 factor (ECF subfamily)